MQSRVVKKNGNLSIRLHAGWQRNRNPRRAGSRRSFRYSFVPENVRPVHVDIRRDDVARLLKKYQGKPHGICSKENPKKHYYDAPPFRRFYSLLSRSRGKRNHKAAAPWLSTLKPRVGEWQPDKWTKELRLVKRFIGSSGTEASYSDSCEIRISFAHTKKGETIFSAKCEKTENKVSSRKVDWE